MKTFKHSALALMLGFSSLSYADIITDTVESADAKKSIEKNKEQLEIDKIKKMDLSSSNFFPADYFVADNKKRYTISIQINARNIPIQPKNSSLSFSLLSMISDNNNYYSNIISNCRNNQSITRQTLSNFESRYLKNQQTLNQVLENVAQGNYSDSDLLAIELLLRTEMEAYRCIYMNAAINIVEQQDYVSQIDDNLRSILKRNLILRNTFDSLRYTQLEMPQEDIIKNRLY